MSEAIQTPAAQAEVTPPAVAPAAKETVLTQAEPAKAEAAPASKEKPAAEVTPPADKATEKPAAEKPAIPEKYELKLPEGAHLDASEVEKVASFAKEKGLSQEQAQAVLELKNASVASFVEKQNQMLKDKPAEWATQAKADKEIGGEKFAENVELAKRALDRFGSAELRKTLNDTGLGNHPELIRAFMNAGKAMAEDKFIASGNQATETKKSAAQVLYPDHK